jgi:hypothetical protein
MADEETRTDEQTFGRVERKEFEADFGKGGFWIGGVILILVGLVFLARNFGFPMPENWWAFFILIPAFASLSRAWYVYRRNGEQMSRAVIAPASAGLVMALVAVLFLFGFDIGRFWPLILIVVGIGALAGGASSRNRQA